MRYARLMLLLILFSGGLATTSYASFTARLYFENLTKGTSNAGALEANRGDLIAVHFVFTGSGASDNKWGVLQVCMGENRVLLQSPDLGSWQTQLGASVQPSGSFLRLFFGPAALFDWSVNPRDGNRGPLMLNPGVFALIAPNVTSSEAKSWDKVLFTFHAAGEPGDELHWSFENRESSTGLNTGLITAMNSWADVTDNFVRVVSTNVRLFGNLNYDFMADAPTPYYWNLDLLVPGTSTVVTNYTWFSPPSPLSTYGFELWCPPGTYDVRFRSEYRFMDIRVPSIFLGDGDNFLDFSPKNGDVTGDNSVDILDLNSVFVEFGNVGGPWPTDVGWTDLDGNGGTDVLDLNIIFVNFGLVGDN